jgi:hypothetical protein
MGGRNMGAVRSGLPDRNRQTELLRRQGVSLVPGAPVWSRRRGTSSCNHRQAARIAALQQGGGCFLRRVSLPRPRRALARWKLATITTSTGVLVASAIAGLQVETAGSARSRTIDLAREFNVRIVGARKGDELGRTVAGIGDMNRDGRPDFVVGAPGADTRGRIRNGVAYVIFGQRRPTVIDLARLGGRGAPCPNRLATPNAAAVGNRRLPQKYDGGEKDDRRIMRRCLVCASRVRLIRREVLHIAAAKLPQSPRAPASTYCAAPMTVSIAAGRLTWSFA